MHADKDAVNQRRYAHSASVNLEQQSWQSVIFAGHFVFHANGQKQYLVLILQLDSKVKLAGRFATSLSAAA